MHCMMAPSKGSRVVRMVAGRRGPSAIPAGLLPCGLHAPFLDLGMQCCLHAQADFKLLKGQPRSFRSSETGTRQFCGDCGTQLFFLAADSPDEMETTIARQA